MWLSRTLLHLIMSELADASGKSETDKKFEKNCFLPWFRFPLFSILLLHSTPLVVPHPLSFPGGGVGDRHLVNPKFFVAPHCVVVWVTVLWGTATCIPCTHGRTFCSLSLKWNLTR